jgi:hypothetical protein
MVRPRELELQPRSCGQFSQSPARHLHAYELLTFHRKTDGSEENSTTDSGGPGLRQWKSAGLVIPRLRSMFMEKEKSDEKQFCNSIQTR